MLTSRCCACGDVGQMYVTKKAGKKSTGVNQVTELTGSFRCPKGLVGCDGDLFTLDRQDDGSHVVCRLDDTSTGSMIQSSRLMKTARHCARRAIMNCCWCVHTSWCCWIWLVIQCVSSPTAIWSSEATLSGTHCSCLTVCDVTVFFHRLSKANSANALVAMTRPTARLKSKTIFSCL